MARPLPDGMRIKRIGDSYVKTENHFGVFSQRRVNSMWRAVALAGARAAKRQVRNVYASRGDPKWPKNTKMTQRMKGNNRPMLGLTASLRDFVEIKPGGAAHFAVGWFGNPHPDTKGRMTVGELAHVHEFGLPSAKNPGPLFVFGIRATNAAIPSRPWLSAVADVDARADKVYAAMNKELELQVYRRLSSLTAPVDELADVGDL